MSSKLSHILRNALKRDAVAPTARSFERACRGDEAGGLELSSSAAVMVDAGRPGIFTPKYFVLARKP